MCEGMKQMNLLSKNGWWSHRVFEMENLGGLSSVNSVYLSKELMRTREIKWLK